MLILNVTFEMHCDCLLTSEQARCLKLLNQSTRALQWSKAWMSSWVTTRFMWACWWMLFWHKTICSGRNHTQTQFRWTSRWVSAHEVVLGTHLRGGSIKPAADRPVTVLAGEMSVFINCTERKSNNNTSVTRSAGGRVDVKVALTSRSSSWQPAGV